MTDSIPHLIQRAYAQYSRRIDALNTMLKLIYDSPELFIKLNLDKNNITVEYISFWLNEIRAFPDPTNYYNYLVTIKNKHQECLDAYAKINGV